MGKFFVNSALAFAAAELITAALHETGHGLAAQALGFSPHIYAFFENNPTGTLQQSVLILAAGPVASLILGVLFLLWYRSSEAGYTFGRLLLFWLAWLGIMEFVNYLIVTPFLSAGDTAQIADLLRWGAPVRYAAAIVGFVLLFALARPAAESMLELAPEGVRVDNFFLRRRFIMRGFFLPLLAGTALTALAGIGGNPAIIGVGMLGTIGNIDIIALALYRAGDVRLVQRIDDGPPRIEPSAIVLYAAMVAFYIFVLSRGLPV